jgi:hypothetical protein
LSLVVLLVAGCARAATEGDLEGLGLTKASSEPPPGVHMPIPPTDLEATTARGQIVARMERALRLAYEQGLSRVGDEAEVVLPLVDVDPGGKSAQVVFVRWTGPAAKDLAIEDARRWVLVSILLGPDQVLDVELLDGAVEPGSHDARRIRSLLAAARHLSKAAPGDLFHLMDLYERFEAEDSKSKTIARVYALSADGDGPDLEVLVDEVKKKHEPAVLSDVRVHPRGKGVASPIVTTTKSPTPITVARAMLSPDGGGQVLVLTADDASWTISAADGRIASPDAQP